ncbi:MAG: cell division protein FtsQ/DivIB [Pararhodobacter sp.]
MSTLSGDPRRRGVEPPLRRPEPMRVDPMRPDPMRPQPMHPGPAGAAVIRREPSHPLHDPAFAAPRAAVSQPTASHPAAPMPPAAYSVATCPVSTYPAAPAPAPAAPFDPLAESAPAIPSAVQSWHGRSRQAQWPASAGIPLAQGLADEGDLVLPHAPRTHAAPVPEAQAHHLPHPAHDALHSFGGAVPSGVAAVDGAAAVAARPARSARSWFAGKKTSQSAPRTRRDPSPSRLAYRLQRLWLTPAVRRGVKAGLPVLVLSCVLGLWLGDDARRGALVQMASELRLTFENRPEFQVASLSVQAETPEVARAIEQRLALDLPVSSFHLDLDTLRRRVEALDAVESAALRIRSGGALEVSVIERVPAMVWRHHGGLDLIDAEGHRVARLAAREARADLPLIVGDGAPAAIAEAQRILAAAAPLSERLRGLVRMGERRWDLVLEHDQRILLPAIGAVAALERVLALDAVQDLLARDVQAVDLRDPSRPTIRMSQPAMAELHRIRNQATGVQNR